MSVGWKTKTSDQRYDRLPRVPNLSTAEGPWMPGRAVRCPCLMQRFLPLPLRPVFNSILVPPLPVRPREQGMTFVCQRPQSRNRVVGIKRPLCHVLAWKGILSGCLTFVFGGSVDAGSTRGIAGGRMGKRRLGFRSVELERLAAHRHAVAQRQGARRGRCGRGAVRSSEVDLERNRLACHVARSAHCHAAARRQGARLRGVS